MTDPKHKMVPVEADDEMQAVGRDEIAKWLPRGEVAKPVADQWQIARDVWRVMAAASPSVPAPAISEWQPIETAPKDGTPILLAWGGKTRLGKWLDNSKSPIMPWAGWRTPSNETSPRGEPAHWMPLPAPPAKDEGKQG